MAATAYLKTAWSAVTTAAKAHAPALSGGMAIVAGAVAFYKVAKAAIKCHEALEQARQDKQDAYDEAIAELDLKRADAMDEDGNVDAEVIEEIEEKRKELSPDLTFKEKFPYYAKYFWSPLLWALAAAFFVVFGIWLEYKKFQAASALALALDTMLKQHLDETKKQVGDKKADSILDAIYKKRADDAISEIQPEDIVNTGDGTALFCEAMFTGQVFRSSSSAVWDAINQLNNMMLEGEEATENDYLSCLKCREVDFGTDLFWSRSVSEQYTSHAALRPVFDSTNMMIDGAIQPVVLVRLNVRPLSHTLLESRCR